MTTRKITPIDRGRFVTYDATQTRITALTEPLARARATLDLLYGLTTDPSGVALESLDAETLPRALASAIEHIDAAVKAAEALEADRVSAATAGGVRP